MPKPMAFYGIKYLCANHFKKGGRWGRNAVKIHKKSSKWTLCPNLTLICSRIIKDRDNQISPAERWGQKDRGEHKKGVNWIGNMGHHHGSYLPCPTMDFVSVIICPVIPVWSDIQCNDTKTMFSTSINCSCPAGMAFPKYNMDSTQTGSTSESGGHIVSICSTPGVWIPELQECECKSLTSLLS